VRSLVGAPEAVADPTPEGEDPHAVDQPIAALGIRTQVLGLVSGQVAVHEPVPPRIESPAGAQTEDRAHVVAEVGPGKLGIDPASSQLDADLAAVFVNAGRDRRRGDRQQPHDDHKQSGSLIRHELARSFRRKSSGGRAPAHRPTRSGFPAPCPYPRQNTKRRPRRQRRGFRRGRLLYRPRSPYDPRNSIRGLWSAGGKYRSARHRRSSSRGHRHAAA
jgi:hypothetical protein